MIETLPTTEVAVDPLDESSHVEATVIRIEGLVKRFARRGIAGRSPERVRPAIDGLTLSVARGSIYGLIGPNGAGKTTTMRILATLIRPTSGSVEVAGVNVLRCPGDARAILGYMPETFGVYDGLSVDEYLDFFGRAYGMREMRRRRGRDEVLELMELTDVRGQPVETLARGTRQRLGLARALMHNPEVLLLDEPGAGLDPLGRMELREILRGLSDMGKTILISSDILLELEEVCTHVGVIRDGRLAIDGPIEQVTGTGERSADSLVIRLLRSEEAERTATLISDLPWCRDVEVVDRVVFSRVEAAEGDIARLLAMLMAHNLEVTGLEHRPRDSGRGLEDLYLETIDPSDNSHG